ncbi:MAG: GTP 3',8-cyclase MoaA [Burkholderiales bacterium]
MSERNIIRIADLRGPRPVSAPLFSSGTHQAVPRDALDRPLRDLRISVTDRCNFRCSYCMPKDVFDKDYRFLPHAQLLTFEEITRLAGVFVSLGVRKIRLTGGEPLLRRHIERLVAQLAELRCPDGSAPELTLTTNGSLLVRKAHDLAAAGLRRVTVSLDAMDDAIFRRMNDVDFPVSEVLAGIEAAQAAGLPVKVNMVVKRGTNDHQVLPMAEHFRHRGVVLRFIEYMDVGGTNGWRMDEVLPSADLQRLLHEAHPLELLPHLTEGETAQRWRYRDGAGEVGFISSVSQAFCGDCNRARLSTEGQLYLCLFAGHGHDLRTLLRPPADQAVTDAQIAAAVAGIWQGRDDRYSALRSQLPPDNGAPAPRRVEMSYIGG